MRRMHTIVAVTLLAVLGPAGLAIAHVPGQGCDHAAPGKNKHCGVHAHGADGDGDRIGAAQDNCDDAFNPGQADLDGDGKGNVCDHALDADKDGDCDAPSPELCGTTERGGKKRAYAPDSDGDGFADKDEDALAPPS